MFIIDAHLDLAWNALTYGRDYTRSVHETRRAEQTTHVPQINGNCMVGLPQLQQARVGIVFATIFNVPFHRKTATDTIFYKDAETAHRLALQQVDYYRRLAGENPQAFTLIQNQSDLKRVTESWQNPHQSGQIGIVILMEGADPIRKPAEVEFWVEQGVRIIGPAWAATRYAGGTGEPGALTALGFELLERMSALPVILDLSHMTDEGTLAALDRFPGTIVATHANPRRLAEITYPERALPDVVIQRIAERDGVIGVVPYNRFLKTGWALADGKQAVPLEIVAAAADIICQLSGSSRHVGIGSDLDGGLGWEHTPFEMDSCADLPKIAPLLAAKGYNSNDIENFHSQNWLRILQKSLPQ
ncbi:MAG TPA: membrane dipeptidase [Anaerolineales bacterium]|nr:membrane dipeptidase [Anaerolineales bacterium]